MWFALFFVFIAATIVHASYFSKYLARTIETIAPRTKRWLGPARITYMVIACSLPILLVFYSLYVLLVQPGSFGLMEHPVVDALLVRPFWFATIWSFQCTLILLPLVAIHRLLQRMGVAASPKWKKGRDLGFLALSLVFLIYIPVRIAIDAHSLEVRHHDILVEGLAAELDGFEIALIADPQADPHTSGERIGQMVDAVLAAKPDLILIAGDIITRDPQYIEVAAKQLGRLEAKHGIYTCVGDHDNFAYMDHERSLREVRAGVEREGIPMLDDEVVSVKVGGATIAVAIITNNYVRQIGKGSARKMLEGAKDADVRVVLAHQASAGLVDVARESGTQLVLSGHTHGGQVNFWTPFGSLVFSKVESPYVTGRYTEGATNIVVSSGIGTSILPYRYRSPATVDIIRLRRKN